MILSFFGDVFSVRRSAITTIATNTPDINLFSYLTPFRLRKPVIITQNQFCKRSIKLTFNQILEEDKNLRIDSEFMKKEYFLINSKIKNHNFNLLNSLATKVSDGTHFTPKYTETGIPFLSALNVQENYLDIRKNYQFISVDEHDLLYKRCNPESNDILLRKVGVGARWACVVPENIFEFSIFVSVALIKCKLNKINPYFLSTFINTLYGQKQLIRFNKGISQPDLHLEEIKKFIVPRFDSSFENKIDKIVRYSQNLREASAACYQQAEDLLLSELGLKDWQPTEETVAIKSFAESFLSSGRLDAEYYQPKQQKVMAIMGQSGLCIGDVVSLAKRKFQPEKQGTFNYIEIGNLSGEGFTNSEVVAMEEAPSRAQWFVKTNDVITSTVRPIRRLSALIESEQNNYICSSGFAVLKPTKIEPEVLLVYLRSPIVCEILDLHTTASMYPAISTEDLLKIPITLPKESTRQKITEKVRESRKAREQSKQLLEIAKTGVERAIETDEATATAWINQQLEALGINLSNSN